MLRSMTGYGRAQQLIDGRDILVEIKSVNHRYLECSVRVPRMYGYLEEKLKSLANGAITRGKVEINVTVYNVESKDTAVAVNEALAKEYVDALRSVKESLELRDDLSLSTLSRLPDVFQLTKTEEDEEAIWAAVQTVSNEAISRFVAMRTVEGERLYADVCSRLDRIGVIVGEVEQLEPASIAEYKERLYAKLNEVLEGKNIEEARVLTEVALFADKIAVDEETVRLRSHLKQFRELIGASEPVGRKLDFLVQEVNREVNTIGSKCQSLKITNRVLEMKGEIEKIREQIQNIE